MALNVNGIQQKIRRILAHTYCHVLYLASQEIFLTLYNEKIFCSFFLKFYEYYESNTTNNLLQ